MYHDKSIRFEILDFINPKISSYKLTELCLVIKIKIMSKLLKYEYKYHHGYIFDESSWNKYNFLTPNIYYDICEQFNIDSQDDI